MSFVIQTVAEIAVMKKTFVTLANSVRKGCHCIAGRELQDNAGHWCWGPWIRPVSQHKEGEVSYFECLCEDGTIPNVLDAVEVPLVSKQTCAHQPENYFIDQAIRWKKLGSIDPVDLLHIEERPANLWIQAGVKTDRIHFSCAVTSVMPFQSLYLIRPTGLRFRIWQDDDELRGGRHKHRRAIFKYGNVEFNLGITDPTMDSRYFQPFPDLNQPAKEIFQKEPERCLLVISLAVPFNDFHYKIVASVIEY